MTAPRALTARQQERISHLEQARQQKLTLQEYARRAGIKASALYAARKWLNQKASRGASVPVSFAEARVVGDGPIEGVVALRGTDAEKIVVCPRFPAPDFPISRVPDFPSPISPFFSNLLGASPTKIRKKSSSNFRKKIERTVNGCHSFHALPRSEHCAPIWLWIFQFGLQFFKLLSKSRIVLRGDKLRELLEGNLQIN